MKAILIDPYDRSVNGIEIEHKSISAAFGAPNKKVLLLTALIGLDIMIYYNAHAGVEPEPTAPLFWLKRRTQPRWLPIGGKGLLLGRKDGSPVSTELTVRQVEDMMKWS